MKLNDILKEYDPTTVGINLRVSCDTRQLQAGDIFVAVPCDKAFEYASYAIRNGAISVVCDHVLAQQLKQVYPHHDIVPVSNPRLTLSQLAARQYPLQPNCNVAVTGTNGKSSTVTFVRQIWEALGIRGVSLGTLGVEFTKNLKASLQLKMPTLTTPDSLSFHHLLHDLAQEGITHLAFESSSHGLAQYRSHQVNLSAAGFTNLTQDHLDYHGTMEAYFSSKACLFTEVLPKEGVAVVNAASPYFSALKLLILGRGQHLISYGVDCEADLKASRIRLYHNAIQFDLSYGGLIWPEITVPMVGNFQVENILCAIGLVMASGVEVERIIPTLSSLHSAIGRMQYVAEVAKLNASIFVDYAHTPDALTRALQALRPHVCTGGKLRLVMGCGGNRDAGKRPLMGEIASQYADVAYITDDNPRHEDAAFIRAQILKKCPAGIEIGDRQLAIEHAIQDLEKNDILLIAGKGHEQGQIVGDNVIAFDDAVVVKQILKNR